MNFNPKTTVETKIIGEEIRQRVTDLAGGYSEKIIRVEDNQVKVALKSLGWTPPEENVYKQLLEELVKKHFYISKDCGCEDSLVWSYINDTPLTEVHGGKKLNSEILRVVYGIN